MYHSSEQFIQHQKCLLFGDRVTEKLVLGVETALECKLVSKNMQNFDNKTWNENAKASCTPGILAKFEQHPTLANLLKSTGNKKIVECCKDKDWGTGVPLHDVNALKPSYWHSQGLLGNILETVRSILNRNTPLTPLVHNVMEHSSAPP